MRLPAFAKINLCLARRGKTPDGYHELRTIFQAISLRDTLELSITPDIGNHAFTLDIERSETYPWDRKIWCIARSRRFAARSDFREA